MNQGDQPNEPTGCEGRVVDLREDGLLWLINRVIFHPRGYALAMEMRDGEYTGRWLLQGDGSEIWRFEGVDEDEKLRRVTAVLGA